MPNLLSDEVSVKPPLSVVEYFDLIALWLRSPVDARTLDKVSKQCCHLHANTYAVRRFGNYRQRLEFKQPNDAALRWIARRKDGLVNRVQITLDYIFDTDEARLATRAFLHSHLARRCHRNQPVQFYKDEWYDGPRTAPNLITDYLEDHSRITGESCCLHLEWRANGVDAVRAAGIIRPSNVFRYNHRHFWERRMLLYAIDDGRLGRLIRNRTEDTRSHIITEADRERGAYIIGFYETIQELIDRFPGIQRVMTRLDNEPFLPRRLIKLYTDLNVPNSDRPIIAPISYRPDTSDYSEYNATTPVSSVSPVTTSSTSPIIPEITSGVFSSSGMSERRPVYPRSMRGDRSYEDE
jgi:hypothetical protein